MNILACYAIGLSVGGAIAAIKEIPTAIAKRQGLREWEELEREYREQKRDRAIENQAGAGYIAPERVREILVACHKSLKGAAGYGPWIASLLDGALTLVHDERGRVTVESNSRAVKPMTALLAVRWTLEELAGSRFRLDVLEAAESELSAIVNE